MLHLDSMAPRQRPRAEFLHGSLTYRDGRLRGFDAAAVVEVIEHLDPPRLGAFEAGEPLYRVHECVFGVLALESEPVDPRL